MFETQEQLRERIDRFLEETGMSASRFGREAVGDPNLVADIRAGRAPSLRLLARVAAFMSAHAEAAE